MGLWDRAQTKPWRAEYDDSDDTAYTADQIVAYIEDDMRSQQRLEDDAGPPSDNRFVQWYNGGQSGGRQLDGDDLDEFVSPLDGHEDQGAIRDAVADRLGLV